MCTKKATKKNYNIVLQNLPIEHWTFFCNFKYNCSQNCEKYIPKAFGCYPNASDTPKCPSTVNEGTIPNPTTIDSNK